MTFFLRLVSLLIWSFSPCSALANDLSLSSLVESTSTVEVRDENWALARESAIDQALRQAVAHRLSQILDAEKVNSGSHEAALETILEESDAYVQSYQIIEEVKDTREKTLVLRLSAGLFNSELAKTLFQLGIGSEKVPGKTKTVLIMGEKNLREDGRELPFEEFQSISEDLLREFFQEKGVKVLHRTELLELADKESLQKSLSGDMEAAMSVGVQAGAEAVILGTAISRKLPPNPKKAGEIAIQANISLRLIRMDKGAVVAARSEFATAFGATEIDSEKEAMKAASLKLGDFFEKQIKELWR